MLDMVTLKSTLTRAAQHGEPASFSRPQDFIKRVLEEIDAVVLPRDLRLDNGAGQTLSLTIKSRRLLRVNGPVPRALGALPGVVDSELTCQGDQMAALAHLMAAFSAHATALCVTASEPAQPDTLTELGICADDLRRGLRIAGYDLPSEMADVMATLREIAQTQGLGWVMLHADEIVAHGGEADTVQQTIDTTLPYLIKAERPKGAPLTSWVFGSGAGPCTAIAMQAGTCLVVTLPATATRAWITASAAR